MKLGTPEKPWMTVVGVVSDIRARGFDDTPEPTMYFAYAQSANSGYYQPRAMSLGSRHDELDASTTSGRAAASSTA